jgi:hypothetical protein
MRFIVTMRDDWWAKPITYFSYLIGSILPALIELRIKYLSPVVGVILFSIYLFIHEFIVAHEIEDIIPSFESFWE